MSALTLSFLELSKLVPCRNCGVGPRGVPLGEFCPGSDPSDPDFHDFGPCDGGAASPSPVAAPSEWPASSVRAPSREPLSGAGVGHSLIDGGAPCA